GPRAKAAEVERADSGIGQLPARRWRSRAAEALSSLQAWEAHRPCTDCGERDLPGETDVQNRNQRRADLCEKCRKRRTERKESVLEFVNTEASYGEDLRIIKEEFYLPMQAAGLLSQEQLLGIFSNIQELIDLNENFLEILQEEIDQAFDQGDDDLMTVCIGEVFLEFVNMLPAFQTYCLQQSSSVNMLNALEKEKELLRIFLNVSQNDNTALRRMNLRSFLMAPLQRVTKYPLLLSRIIKATTEYHPDHGSLREAKSRIESHLEHINMKTKQEGNTWTLRSFRQDSKKKREVINIEMRETALKTVGWLREETRFVMEGSLQLAQPPDGQWVKKGSKTLKFQNMQVLLLVNMKRVSESSLESAEPGPVKDAVLVLIRDKNNGKFHLLREPLRLSNCIVSTDPDCDDTFELIEIRREAFVLRDSDRARTHHWFRQIRRYSRELGSWKKRRNALPNIMISTPHTRP
ncbi:MYOM protein, partial [Urocolius indicus]|nr:MYOM protein [Urocolius indicus]